MNVEPAPDIEKLVHHLVPRLPFAYIDPSCIHGMRSFGATSRARARIWSFPKIWQMALGIKPQYVIEVLSQYFDNLSPEDKLRVIIHELMHIPKNFSGALVPHRGKHKKINTRSVEDLYRVYQETFKK